MSPEARPEVQTTLVQMIDDARGAYDAGRTAVPTDNVVRVESGTPIKELDSEAVYVCRRYQFKECADPQTCGTAVCYLWQRYDR